MQIVELFTENAWDAGTRIPVRRAALEGRENCLLSRMSCDVADPILSGNNSGNFADGEPTRNKQ